MEIDTSIDARTELNTELNKSTMFDATNNSKSSVKSKKRKSLKINTSVITNSSILNTSNAAKKIDSSLSPLKSILKSPDANKGSGDFIRIAETSTNNETEMSGSEKIIERPRTLDEFMKRESLVPITRLCSFNLTDLDEDDELWVIDIPKSINPHDLMGQTINFTDKSKIKIGSDRFVAVPSNGPECFTCILGTGKNRKPYKTVNINSNGTVVVRKKLPGLLKKNFKREVNDINDKVPFPSNLKIRHPLLGVHETKMKKKKNKRRSRKHLE